MKFFDNLYHLKFVIWQFKKRWMPACAGMFGEMANGVNTFLTECSVDQESIISNS